MKSLIRNSLCLQVNVALNEIEFLNLDDVSSQQERAFLLGCVRSKKGETPDDEKSLIRL